MTRSRAVLAGTLAAFVLDRPPRGGRSAHIAAHDERAARAATAAGRRSRSPGGSRNVSQAAARARASPSRCGRTRSARDGRIAAVKYLPRTLAPRGTRAYRLKRTASPPPRGGPLPRRDLRPRGQQGRVLHFSKALTVELTGARRGPAPLGARRRRRRPRRPPRPIDAAPVRWSRTASPSRSTATPTPSASASGSRSSSTPTATARTTASRSTSSGRRRPPSGLKVPIIMDASPYYDTVCRGNEGECKSDVDGDGLNDKLAPVLRQLLRAPRLRGRAARHRRDEQLDRLPDRRRPARTSSGSRASSTG